MSTDFEVTERPNVGVAQYLTAYADMRNAFLKTTDGTSVAIVRDATSFKRVYNRFYSWANRAGKQLRVHSTNTHWHFWIESKSTESEVK